MSIFQSIGKAFSDAGKAIGSVATDVYETARNSVVIQAAGAIATGGMSLLVQGAVEAASGKGGPISQAVQDIGKDPLGVAKQIPGLLLSTATGIGIVGDAAGILGRQTGMGVAQDAARILQSTDKTMREDPLASLGIIAGAAMIVTGAGAAAGAASIASGVAKIAGNVVVGEVKRNADAKAAAATASLAQMTGTTKSGLSGSTPQKTAGASSSNSLLFAAAAGLLLMFGL